MLAVTAGERVLCEVAQRLAGCVRDADTLGRIRGRVLF
jgi:GGDEF domain-containing protein